MFDDPDSVYIFTTVAGLLLLTGGIALIYQAYFQFVEMKRTKGTPTSQISGLTDGYQKIRGRIIKGDKILLSPMTSTICVYYEFTVAERLQDGLKEIICDKKTTGWSLDDGTGTAAIELDGAKLLLDLDHHDKSGTLDAPSSDLEAILQRYGKRSKGLLFHKGLNYEETILEEGDELFVQGTAKVVDGTICFKASRRQRLVVTDMGERDFVECDNREALKMAFAGPLCIVIAVALLAYPDAMLEVIEFINHNR
jgi:hypothetical protein